MTTLDSPTNCCAPTRPAAAAGAAVGTRSRVRSATAYAVEAELVALRRAAGHRTVGRKVGFANKAVWRVLKLETLVWAHMYDDTVRYAPDNDATLSIGALVAPKIEPEIVFKLKAPLAAGADDAGRRARGGRVDRARLRDHRLRVPRLEVPAGRLRRRLRIARRARRRRAARVTPAMTPARCATFTLRLSKNGELVEEGAGKKALRSPALCLGELAAAIARQPRGAARGRRDHQHRHAHDAPADRAWGEVDSGGERTDAGRDDGDARLRLRGLGLKGLEACTPLSLQALSL